MTIDYDLSANDAGDEEWRDEAIVVMENRCPVLAIWAADFLEAMPSKDILLQSLVILADMYSEEMDEYRKAEARKVN